ncbi:hypothetical protein GCM10022409_48130 [Hymenobacter glaciei]|uniref:DUF1153 domain-containing protein n=1 Tax=Hymenobacter glaciei TaxID=877209 RepID=A0ABP7UXZ0_9BACT
MSNPTTPDFFDTDGHSAPVDAAEELAERKLKVWAVLNAVDQGLMNANEACAAYNVSPAELDEHRADWREFEAGRR